MKPKPIHTPSNDISGFDQNKMISARNTQKAFLHRL